MSSKVAPYFILTAEKVIDPNELKELLGHDKHLDSLCREVPATPPCSWGTGDYKKSYDFPLGGVVHKGKTKGFVKYKIPVKEIRRKESLNKKMELIKEKLEKSRERYKEQKERQTGDLTTSIKCEPSHTWYDPEKPTGVSTMDAIDENETGVHMANESKKVNGQPYVYFVVSDNDNDAGERKKLNSSAKKRSALKDRKSSKKGKHGASIVSLAREIGLRTSIELKPDSRQGDPIRSSSSHLMFPNAIQEPPKPQFPSNPKGLRSIPSPPRIPPGTPATIISGENKVELLSSGLDVDETVPRKPFLSEPMYGGKTKGIHSTSLQHFDFPTISADQKRRALGLGTRFEEFAYPKPMSEQRQRKVSFADPLPVIRGSGFVLSSANEMKDSFTVDTPALGPRAVTMGSITLPSEQTSKQTMCQKYISGESMASARKVRYSGIPLPLPKIDIVSNVYDEMIIKMIQEYLQDSNTPSRQSQLARELLVHLQKHNEHMKELNVPNVNKKNKSKITKAVQQHRQKVQELISNANSTVPPNTAEDQAVKVMSPGVKTTDMFLDTPNLEDEDENQTHSRSTTVPYVQISFKSKADDTPDDLKQNGDFLATKQPDGTGSASRPRKNPSKPILSVVTPVSFQMAPPGLSRDSSFVSLPSMKA